jgi:Abortive infection alpha
MVEMTHPDPIQGAVAGLAKEAFSVILKQAEDFLAAATGQEGKSLGTMLGSMFRRRRKNATVVVAAAEQIRVDSGAAVGEIPLRILQPALEGASLEDDPDIQAKWACLLANAADPREVTPVSPMFPYILRDLGPREVKFLDALYATSLQKLEGDTIFKRVSQIIYQQDDLQDLFVRLGFARTPNLSAPTFEQQQNPDFARDHNAFFLLIDVIRTHDVIRQDVLPNVPLAPPLRPGQRIFYFSELGAAFVLACLPPPKVSS